MYLGSSCCHTNVASKQNPWNKIKSPVINSAAQFKTKGKITKSLPFISVTFYNNHCAGQSRKTEFWL